MTDAFARGMQEAERLLAQSSREVDGLRHAAVIEGLLKAVNGLNDPACRDEAHGFIAAVVDAALSHASAVVCALRDLNHIDANTPRH